MESSSKPSKPSRPSKPSKPFKQIRQFKYRNGVKFTLADLKVTEAKVVEYASSLDEWKSRRTVRQKKGFYYIIFNSDITKEVHYKIIVDDKWMLLPERFPVTAPDADGNINNLIKLEESYKSDLYFYTFNRKTWFDLRKYLEDVECDAIILYVNYFVYPETGRFKGNGRINLLNPDDASLAKKKFDGLTIKTRDGNDAIIAVDYFKLKE